MAKNGNGDKWLVGYRKFLVAVIWTVLMAFVVVWSIVVIKPSAGQATIVIWLIASGGFFCSFFVGGNALATLWTTKYGPPQTTSNLTHTTKEETKELVIDYKYNGTEDTSFSAAFEGDEKTLPKPKPR